MSGRILNVPYKSQYDPDAALKRSDCGPACLAMILGAVGKWLSIDAVRAASGMTRDGGLRPDQIIDAARAFGLEMLSKTDFTLDAVKRLIDMGRPPIALIQYGRISDRWDRKYTGGYFVVVVGYDDATRRVFVNDPGYPPGARGYQRPYSYQTFLNAWGGFEPAENYNFCLVAPHLPEPVPGAIVSPSPADSSLPQSDLRSSPTTVPVNSHDAWVVAPPGLPLRAQPAFTADLVAKLVFAQHLIALSNEADSDAARRTGQRDRAWRQVRTDAGVTGWVAANLSGVVLLSETQPDAPRLAQVLDKQAVRDAGGLSVRKKRDFNERPHDRAPVGERLMVYSTETAANGTPWLFAQSPRGRLGWVREQVGSSTLVGKIDLESVAARDMSTPTPAHRPGPIRPVVDVRPFGKCLTGLGMGNPQPLTPVQQGLVAKSKVEAFKMLTLPHPDDNARLIRSLRDIPSIQFIIARLFFAVDAEHHFRFSPQLFVDTVFDGAEAAYRAGVRYFEVHNEPNLESEGMGWNWTGGEDFGAWLAEVMATLRRRLPEGRFGFPGLSPQPNVPAFLEGAASAIGKCDWIGIHCYWQSADQGHFPMTHANAGMYWRRFRDRYPDKLLMITEFSNNSAGVDPEEKGRQYARYYQLLRHERNLGAAFAFAISWPGQDANREGWESDGVETDIPGTLGSLIGQPEFFASR